MLVDKVNYRGVWLPWSDATTDDEDTPAWRALVGWIVENCPDYNARLALMPNSSKPEGHGAEYQWLTINHTSHRSHHGPWLGPVVCAWPDEAHLATAVRTTAASQTLIALEWPTLDLTGWATAVQAFNPRTGMTAAPLTPELHRLFESMLIWTTELGGGAIKGRGHEKPQRYLRQMKQAGLDEDFVVTYSVAVGLAGWQTKKLREHYRAA